MRLVSEAMKGGSSVRWFSVSERCVTFVRSETCLRVEGQGLGFGVWGLGFRI